MIFNEIKKNSEKVAIITESVHITYNEIYMQYERLLSIFKGKNLILFVCINSVEAIIGYLAFLNCEQVPLMVEGNLKNEEIENLENIYKPEYLYLPYKYLKNYKAYTIIYNYKGYVLLKTNYVNSEEIFSELALLLPTSGSLGSKKYVRQSYNNILQNANAIVKYLNIDKNEKPILTLPINYTYGLSIVNSHVLVGATLLLSEKKIIQKEFWDFFEREQATSFSGVPYTYEILKKIGFLNKKYKHLKTLTQAGGKLKEELQKEFTQYVLRNKKNFYIMYGQTEATARMTYLPCHEIFDKFGCVGKVIPGGEIEILDYNGTGILSELIEGEVIYKGDNVSLGYANCRKDLCMGNVWNGVLMTGDIGYKDADGYLYITGRKKRFIKLYGKRYNLDEIENKISLKYNIELCCVGNDESIILYLLKQNLLLKEEIIDYIYRETKIPPRNIFVRGITEIPRSSSGKVEYNNLNRNFVIV